MEPLEADLPKPKESAPPDISFLSVMQEVMRTTAGDIKNSTAVMDSWKEHSAGLTKHHVDKIELEHANKQADPRLVFSLASNFENLAGLSRYPEFSSFMSTHRNNVQPEHVISEKDIQRLQIMADPEKRTNFYNKEFAQLREDLISVRAMEGLGIGFVSALAVNSGLQYASKFLPGRAGLACRVIGGLSCAGLTMGGSYLGWRWGESEAKDYWRDQNDRSEYILKSLQGDKSRLILEQLRAEKLKKP